MKKLITLINITSVLLIASLFFCCSPKDPGPNVRVMPGIEFCNPACDKMQKLYDEGDQSCFDYIEVIIVDDKEMNCTQFCEYQMENSVQLNPKCIYEEIETCSEVFTKCEN